MAYLAGCGHRRWSMECILEVGSGDADVGAVPGQSCERTLPCRGKVSVL